MTSTILRRLEGITYWVIENQDEIREFVNSNLRREWEADVRDSGGSPREDPWLLTLPKRNWRLETLDTKVVRLNPDIVNYKDPPSGYDFEESLTRRTKELRRAIEDYGSVIWPVVVRGEDLELADGYCRLATLKEKGISRTYAYIGTLQL